MDIAEIQKQSEMAPQTPMPCYISHKRVWALKIERVHADEHGQGVVLIFEGHRFGPLAFTNSQLEHKPVPCAGMYYVQYEGGYFSFSPSDAFEQGYSPAEEEPVVEKITVTLRKCVLTPWGEMKTLRIVQETKWGILGELSLTGPQAQALAVEIQKRLGTPQSVPRPYDPTIDGPSTREG